MKKGNKIENGELVIIVLVSLFVFFTILQNVVVRQQDTAVRTDNYLEPESSGMKQVLTTNASSLKLVQIQLM